MKKKIFLGVLVLIMVAMFSACGKKEETGLTPKTPEEELTEVNVVLDWYPNAVHSFIYAANENGYYEEEGLKVNVLFPSNENDAISLTASGQADIGVYYLKDVIMTRVNSDVPVKSIGAIVQKPLNVVMSLKEAKIEGASDLYGKKLGYSGTPSSEAEIESMAEFAGFASSDIELINVGFDLMAGIITGNIDAAIGCYINHEVPAMEAEGYEVNYFSPSDFGVPTSHELVFIAGENGLSQNPEIYEKFLRASKKGFKFVKENPEDALNILIANQNAENFPLDLETEEKSLEILLPLMETENAEFLSQNKEVWQENIDWLFERGITNKTINAEDIIW